MVFYYVRLICRIWPILPNFLVQNFGIDKVDAGIRTGVFIALATCLRPLGGILGDKFNAVTMLKIFFSIMIAGAFILGVSSQISLFTIGCLTVSVCAGIGNGLVFKLVPHYFTKEAGVANGIVSMMGAWRILPTACHFSCDIYHRYESFRIHLVMCIRINCTCNDV